MKIKRRHPRIGVGVIEAILPALLVALAVLCTQQRCSLAPGNTLRSAAHAPSAPSPVTSFGSLMRAAFFLERDRREDAQTLQLSAYRDHRPQIADTL